MEHQFIIPYAVVTCTNDQVGEVFGEKLSIAAHTIESVVKRDRRTGRMFKTFIVHVHPSRESAHLATYIEQCGHTEVVYSAPYFWKIKI